MEQLPQDPVMLMSWLNTQLRDNYGGDLDELCKSIGADRAELEQRLQAAGFEWNAQQGKFW